MAGDKGKVHFCPFSVSQFCLIRKLSEITVII